MLYFHAVQTGKHLLRTQNVSEINQKHFLCPGQNVCPQQMLRARTNGETQLICWGESRLEPKF